MNNKLILLAIGMIFITTASALQEGDVYTQAQINSQNFDTFNLECSQDYVNLGIIQCGVGFSCFNLKENDKGGYVVYRSSWYIPYQNIDFVKCLIGTSRVNCVNSVKTTIAQSHKARVAGIRIKLKGFQDTDGLIASDLNFNQTEVNP